MENGRYLSEFAQRRDHPMTQAALLAELKANHPYDWPRIWGTLWGHREACMLAALRALDAALAEPKLTRRELRRQMLAALAGIAEDGPEAVPTRVQSGANPSAGVPQSGHGQPSGGSGSAPSSE